MSLIVQKFGGTSVADTDSLRIVAERIIDCKKNGNDVVVVPSAMGSSTDELIQLANDLSENPTPRELDMLLSAGERITMSLLSMHLNSLGYSSFSLTGSQAGIITTSRHGQAEIEEITGERVKEGLENGDIVIVAGFQGFNRDTKEITTLGRGGSDATAVALAAALGAERCEIFTDVEGIYTTDPRIVNQARKLEYINYEDMLEMAVLGAKMHPRSIELASVYNVPVYVAGTFSKKKGTLITKGDDMENNKTVTGIAIDKNVSKVTIKKIKNQPGTAASILKPLSDQSISIDIIVQNIPMDGYIDFSFSVSDDDLERVYDILMSQSNLEFEEVIQGKGFAKISLVGTGMQNAPGYATDMFNALGEENVEIEMITTSEIRITCIIKSSDLELAAKSLHKEFIA